MLLFFFGFTIIDLLSLIFNLLLFLTVYTHSDKTRIPTVYIYNMLLANSIDTITLFLLFLLPFWMSESFYQGFRNSIGPLITLSGSFSFEHTLYLTLLMIIHRICAVAFPMNRLFTGKMIWIYCAVISVFSLISLFIPYFSNCQVNVNVKIFDFQSACPERHPITNFQRTYLFIIPITSMLLNIALIIHLAFRAGKMSIRTGSNRIGVISLISIIPTSYLPPVQRSKSRENFEITLILQSISTTTFLLLYDFSRIVQRIFSEEHDKLSEDTRRFIYYSRLAFCAPLCFLVYFVGTPSIRRLITEKIVNVHRKYKGNREISSVIL